MSVMCDLLLAVGITLGGHCSPSEGTAPLPSDEHRVWRMKRPAPPPPPPAPKPVPARAPAFPPVVVKEVVEKTVIKEVPSPAEPRRATPAPKPDLIGIAARDAYGWRTGGFEEGATVIMAALTDEMEAPGLSATKGTGRFRDKREASISPRYRFPGVRSSLPVDNARIVAADRYITGVLETGINSQLDGSGGEVVIQTSNDVFGYHGRNKLIPKGSRLVCSYVSPEAVGSTRLALACDRILVSGHRAEIYQLAATGGDAQGRAGVTGEVDNRFFEKYGTALLLAAISTTVRGATAAVRTATDEADASGAAVADDAASELSEKFGEITASVLEQSVSLAPIITVPQGTRVQIRPSRDWYIRRPGETPLAPASSQHQATDQRSRR